MFTTIRTMTAALIATTALAACDSSSTTPMDHPMGTEPPVVSISALHGHPDGDHGWQFQLPDEVIANNRTIDSGWTTFELENLSNAEHFVLLFRAPDDVGDISMQEWRDAVTDPFQQIMDYLIDPENVPSSELAEWFGEVESHGGPGFTAGGITSATTVHLSPGIYFLDCYVKDENGQFHSFMGMLERIEVTENENGATPPEATMELRVSSAGGIDFDVPSSSGPQTVAVEFVDQEIYDHLLGHDVHLVRLDGGGSAAEVDAWMNWMAPEGLVAPAPASFVGGVQTILTPGMLAGAESSTAYFHVDLAPGRYAWVSEVPEPGAKGLWEEFTIP